eukprot:8364848-Pyramimonas_sp.AAC.1
MKLGGLTKPSAPACADVIAMLAMYAWSEDVTAMQLFDEVGKLTKSFKTTRAALLTETDLPLVKEYPANPHDLPEAVFQAMFPDPSDPPVAQVVGNFFVVRDLTSCRSSRKHVRDLLPKTRGTPMVAGAAGSFGNMPVKDFMAAAMEQGLTPQQAFQQMSMVPAAGLPWASQPLAIEWVSPDQRAQQPRTFQLQMQHPARSVAGANPAGASPAGASSSGNAVSPTTPPPTAPLGQHKAEAPAPSAQRPAFGTALSEFDGAKSSTDEVAEAEKKIKAIETEYEELLRKAKAKKDKLASSTAEAKALAVAKAAKAAEKGDKSDASDDDDGN